MRPGCIVTTTAKDTGSVSRSHKHNCHEQAFSQEDIVIMKQVRSTPPNDRSDPYQHSSRKWVEHSRTARALDVIFTLYFSEQISDFVKARKAGERGRK